ncbi:cation:proton antiporter [Cupriavidus gilardii]|uniref:cation:proton antiporter n=1 Tax=Cupriavidus gilardii TaxID=82541 RepID=UPI0007E3C98C|nr:cation:proton antiporter [Cupriavidus gilardii]
MNGAAVFFLQAAIVVGLPYALWRLFGKGRVLPLVVVQILVGIGLGPTGFGRWFPEAWATLFGPQALSMLGGLQWLAVTLFCFLTGLHLRETELGGQPRAAVAAGVGGIVLPFCLGTAAGAWLVADLPQLAGPNAGPIGFALVLGLCSAVTALPVLAAILREMGMASTGMGHLALRCAALTDGVVWLALAVVLVGHGEGAGPLGVAALALTYLAACLLVARPLLARWLSRDGWHAEPLLAVALVTVLVSAFLSELVGLHHVMGGFVAGLVWPRQHASQIRKLLEPATVVVLLPFFFLAAGLRTTVGMADGEVLRVFAIAVVVAVVGKTVGVAVPARLAGLDWRQAWTLGALLQTKGLVEVVVLGILLDAGLIAGPAFSGLLWMALATTVLARPLAAIAMRARGNAWPVVADRAAERG